MTDEQIVFEVLMQMLKEKQCPIINSEEERKRLCTKAFKSNEYSEEFFVRSFIKDMKLNGVYNTILQQARNTAPPKTAKKTAKNNHKLHLDIDTEKIPSKAIQADQIPQTPEQIMSFIFGTDKVQEPIVQKKAKTEYKPDLDADRFQFVIPQPKKAEIIIIDSDEEIPATKGLTLQKSISSPVAQSAIVQRTNNFTFQETRNDYNPIPILKRTLNQCRECQEDATNGFDLSDKDKLCPKCCLRKSNPFKEILQEIGFYQYVHQQPNKRCAFALQLIPNAQLEIRCVQMSQQGLSEQTFPHSCRLIANKHILHSTVALLEKVCTKKRKDNSFITDLDRFVNIHQKSFYFNVESYEAQNNCRSDKIGTTYIFGLFVVRSRSRTDLMQRIPGAEEFEVSIADIEVERQRVSLLCPLSLSLMKQPARGAYCLHRNCFDLENLLKFWEDARHLRQQCPICQRSMYFIVIDKMQLKIIEKIKELRLKVDSITLDNQVIIYSRQGKLDVSDEMNKYMAQVSIKNEHVPQKEIIISD